MEIQAKSLEKCLKIRSYNEKGLYPQIFNINPSKISKNQVF